MDLKKVKYACEEHIDIAIDDLIYDTESFPIMEMAESHKCEYCDKIAKYGLKV
ncbi:MAG: CxxH/CxxC protein [Sarcina sp.]